MKSIGRTTRKEVFLMHILNFGSLNIDRSYVVPHLVREGETLSSVEMKVTCGGKGLNQSIALARAGLLVSHAGKIGTDGLFLLDKLKESGVDVSLVTITEESVTGHAVIQVDMAGRNSIVLYGGANQAITREEADRVLAHFGPGDWLFLQNEVSCLPYIICAASRRGMTVVLNPSPLDDTLLHMELDGVSWFILNEIEGEGLAGEREPERICAKLQARWPGSKVILTLGEQGAVCSDGDSYYRQECFPARTVDSTAAGDTFTGYFFAALCRGRSPQEALEQAGMAAALAVSRRGAAASIPTQAEVDRALTVWHQNANSSGLFAQ